MNSKLLLSGRILLSIFLSCSYPFITATPGAPCPKSLQKSIGKLFSEYHIPGASIAIVRNGKLQCIETLGNADIATKRPVARNTLFQACSITKTLTSIAVLQVADKYKIPLDVAFARLL